MCCVFFLSFFFYLFGLFSMSTFSVTCTSSSHLYILTHTFTRRLNCSTLLLLLLLLVLVLLLPLTLLLLILLASFTSFLLLLLLLLLILLLYWHLLLILSFTTLLLMCCKWILEYKQYKLRLVASDNLNENFTTVVIHIKDVNDNPPAFDRPKYETQITEEDDRVLPRRILQVTTIFSLLLLYLYSMHLQPFPVSIRFHFRCTSFFPLFSVPCFLPLFLSSSHTTLVTLGTIFSLWHAFDHSSS